jgi:hypothetical protein
MHDEAGHRSSNGLISLRANVRVIQPTCQCYFVANNHFKWARYVAWPLEQSRVTLSDSDLNLHKADFVDSYR